MRLRIDIFFSPFINRRLISHNHYPGDGFSNWLGGGAVLSAVQGRILVMLLTVVREWKSRGVTAWPVITERRQKDFGWRIENSQCTFIFGPFFLLSLSLFSSAFDFATRGNLSFFRTDFTLWFNVNRLSSIESLCVRRCIPTKRERKRKRRSHLTLNCHDPVINEESNYQDLIRLPISCNVLRSWITSWSCHYHLRLTVSSSLL